MTKTFDYSPVLVSEKHIPKEVVYSVEVPNNILHESRQTIRLIVGQVCYEIPNPGISGKEILTHIHFTVRQ